MGIERMPEFDYVPFYYQVRAPTLVPYCVWIGSLLPDTDINVSWRELGEAQDQIWNSWIGRFG